MAKSKSPRKNSSSSPPPSSKSRANSVSATAVALQAAIVNTPSSSSASMSPPPTPQPKHSPPASPKHQRRQIETSSSPSSLPTTSSNNIKDVMQLGAKEFTDVKGSSRPSVRGQRAGARSNVLAPSALSTNLFDNLSRQPSNHDHDDNQSESSESSEDSELDYSSSSSESSNSSHSSEDEESEEEDLYNDNEEEDEDDAGEDETKKDTNIPNGKVVPKKQQRQQAQKVKVQQKQAVLSQEQQQRPSKSRQQSATNGSLQSQNQNGQPPHQQQQQQQQQVHHVKGSENDKENVVLLADESAKAKWANWSVRTLWTLIMIGGFFACVAAGPLFVMMLVVMVQFLVYKEVIYLANVPSKEKKLPWFRTMNWYFLFSTNYFFYGESLIHYFQHVVFVDAFLLPFATHHRFISFALYVTGFVFFVANLKKGHYRFQFSQFAWTHMTLLLVVCQSHFIINNIFEGLIWFFLPCSLVIANDIWAYIFGFFWGKTPLIKLSPKKTVEGFVGGWIMTIFFGILFATLFLQYPYMICPVKDLTASAFSGVTCEPNPVFVPVKYYLKPWMVALVRHLGMRNYYVMIAPLQLHTIFMACFASLIAPFGGFFASGFKRAFKIKDFGQSIPGHGGITDRMDCQFIMGLFSYMYYQSFIKTTALSVGIVLQSAINNLQGHEQMELFDHMRQYLIGQGLLDDESCIVMPPKEAWIS